MPDLPVMLKLAGRRCVIVGGGDVARRRATALVESGAAVTVIAPEVRAELMEMNVTIHRRRYQSGDVASATLVVAATDDEALNASIENDARAAGALVNRADQSESGDLSIPAHAHHGHVTIAVDTGGVSAAAAAVIRRLLSDTLDADWPRLLRIVAEYRGRVRRQWTGAERRKERLIALTSPEAMETLKRGGEAALRHYCDDLCGDTEAPSRSL